HGRHERSRLVPVTLLPVVVLPSRTTGTASLIGRLLRQARIPAACYGVIAERLSSFVISNPGASSTGATVWAPPLKSAGREPRRAGSRARHRRSPASHSSDH